MFLYRDTKKTAAKVLEDLPKACAAHQFGVLGTLDLRAKLREKGQDCRREVVVFEVCNPGHAKRALDADMAISTMLPCRISVYERSEGGLRIATVKPTVMMAAMNNPVIEKVAREVEQTLDAILHDAAG
jgi:uncharacterized protein (DUF302 family)